MSEGRRNEADRKALARRNILTAVALGIVALCLYAGYFLFKYLT